MMNLQLRSDFRCKYGDHIQHTQDESKFSEHDTPARADFLPNSGLSEQLVCLTESQVAVEMAGVRGSGKHLLCKWTGPFYPISSNSFNYHSHPLFPEQTHPMYSGVHVVQHLTPP